MPPDDEEDTGARAMKIGRNLIESMSSRIAEQSLQTRWRRRRRRV